MRKNKQVLGFTLVEVMIVVAIIGLLAVIGIPAYSRARNKSQLELCRNNQRVIFEQLNICCLDRNVPCTTDLFPDLVTVADALAPLAGGPAASYIKTRRAFACPSNPDQTLMNDYSFVRDGRRIVGIECAFSLPHNL